jgi:hypothetical protein
MPRPPNQPEGIPKTIIPPAGPSTNPVDLGDGARTVQPRPAVTGTTVADKPRGAGPPSQGGDQASARDLPGRQPSDAAPPPDDEGPLESLGKAVSAPVREAAGDTIARGRDRDVPSGSRGGAPR